VFARGCRRSLTRTDIDTNQILADLTSWRFILRLVNRIQFSAALFRYIESHVFAQFRREGEMSKQQHLCPLGFTNQLFAAGSHICQIYSDDDERIHSSLGFLESGLKNGEKTACFNRERNDSALAERLAQHGLSLPSLTESKALTMAETSEVYFLDGCFSPERMLGRLQQFYEDSVSEGFTAARVIGEMIVEIRAMKGGDRLMEYESRVSLQMRTYPVTAVCQYDANAFDGATIMQVLKVHPLMVIRGTVVHNPYFVPPEEYLKQFQAN